MSFLLRFALTTALTGSLLVACGGGGGGGGSPDSGGTTAAIAVPTGVTAQANGAKGVTLNWTVATGATGYNIYRATSSNQALASMTKVNASPIGIGSVPYVDTGLSPSSTYFYKITAFVSGSENASSEVSAATKATSALTQMGGNIQGNPLTLTGAVTNVTSGLNSATYVTADRNFIYVSDQGSRSVLKVDPSTGTTTVLLGNGTCSAVLCSPRGLTTDGTNLYITDESAGVIQKIVLATGAASNYLTGFNLPNAITTDGVNLYIADIRGITKVNLTTNASSRLTSTRATNLTTDGNTLYIIDTLNQSAINKVDMSSGTVTLFAGSSGMIGIADGVGTQATFRGLRAIATDGTTLYLAANNTNGPLSARRIDISSATVSTISSVTSGLGVATDGLSVFYTAPGTTTGDVLNKLQ